MKKQSYISILPLSIIATEVKNFLVFFGQVPTYVILLIRDMVVESCYRRFGRETIHPTQKFTSMNLLQMPCMIT